MRHPYNALLLSTAYELTIAQATLSRVEEPLSTSSVYVVQ